jgi:hypothetical protein
MSLFKNTDLPNIVELKISRNLLRRRKIIHYIQDLDLIIEDKRRSVYLLQF